MPLGRTAKTAAPYPALLRDACSVASRCLRESRNVTETVRLIAIRPTQRCLRTAEPKPRLTRFTDRKLALRRKQQRRRLGRLSVCFQNLKPRSRARSLCAPSRRLAFANAVPQCPSRAPCG